MRTTVSIGPPDDIRKVDAMTPETCESCGREFACGAQDASCWCREAVLDRDRLAILREHFERCLCPDCLALAARERSTRA
jgi:hypothetical protein